MTLESLLVFAQFCLSGLTLGFQCHFLPYQFLIINSIAIEFILYLKPFHLYLLNLCIFIIKNLTHRFLNVCFLAGQLLIYSCKLCLLFDLNFLFFFQFIFKLQQFIVYLFFQLLNLLLSIFSYSSELFVLFFILHQLQCGRVNLLLLLLHLILQFLAVFFQLLHLFMESRVFLLKVSQFLFQLVIRYLQPLYCTLFLAQLFLEIVITFFAMASQGFLMVLLCFKLVFEGVDLVVKLYDDWFEYDGFYDFVGSNAGELLSDLAIIQGGDELIVEEKGIK